MVATVGVAEYTISSPMYTLIFAVNCSDSADAVSFCPSLPHCPHCPTAPTAPTAPRRVVRTGGLH